MSKSLPLVVRHAMYKLRGGFLIRPLTIALALGFVGASMSWLEEEYPAVSSWDPPGCFPRTPIRKLPKLFSRASPPPS